MNDLDLCALIKFILGERGIKHSLVNLFTTINGTYCNCWVNQHLENYWLPKLQQELVVLDAENIN